MANKLFISAASLALGISAAQAAQVEMNTAQMQAMDKITGRVSLIEVPVGGETTFGSFSVVVRSCQAKSEDETPENVAFVDVTDKSFDQEEYNIFKGWMFSSSPSVHAVEHPIYDVWLLKCMNTEVAPERLLSQEALAARDALPSLQKVKESAQKTQNFEIIDVETPQTIRFENSIYKEEYVPQEKDNLPAPAVDGAPQDLLTIDEDYVPMEEEETVVLPPEEFSKAVEEESENLREEAAEAAALNAAIDAELAAHAD